MSRQHTIPEIIRPDIHQSQALQAGVIHLYVVSVPDLLHEETALLSYIHPEEDARAGRFIKPEHGRRYRCIRGMLRKLLAHYLNSAPDKLEFSYAAHGKPSLQDHHELQFNLSHSCDMAAFAFCLGHELGVDIEYMRTQKDLAGMMRHVGSEKERAELNALNEADAVQAFYRLWTRKEAFIKAVGRGLGMGLRSIHIGTGEDSSPRRIEYKNVLSTEWFVQDMTPPDDYKLAVCGQFIGD